MQARKPAPVVTTGYLPPTTWTRDALADRLRYWRRDGFTIERLAPRVYRVRPYIISTTR